MSGSHEDILNVISGVVYSENEEKSQRNYDDWSKNYDQDIEQLGGFLPQRSVECFMKHAEGRKLESVLDLGAGTGLVGYHLRNMKYQGSVDIMDANMEMLYVAYKKNLNFRNVIRHWVSGELPVRDGSYDALFCVGSFIPNHIPVASIPGIFKCVRKGGLLLFSTRVQSTEGYKKEFDKMIESLEEKGDIKRLGMNEYIHFENVKNKINSAIYVYEKV